MQAEDKHNCTSNGSVKLRQKTRKGRLTYHRFCPRIFQVDSLHHYPAVCVLRQRRQVLRQVVGVKNPRLGRFVRLFSPLCLFFMTTLTDCENRLTDICTHQIVLGCVVKIHVQYVMVGACVSKKGRPQVRVAGTKNTGRKTGPKPLGDLPISKRNTDHN